MRGASQVGLPPPPHTPGEEDNDPARHHWIHGGDSLCLSLFTHSFTFSLSPSLKLS